MNAESVQRKNELRELVRLEVRHDIAEIITGDPVLRAADSTFLHWTTGIIRRSPDAKTAVANFRNLSRRLERSAGDFSERQLAALSLPDTRLEPIFTHAKAVSVREARRRINQRVSDENGHRWNDDYELRQRPKRSLQMLRQNGLTIHIDESALPMIRENGHEDAFCPILDRVKNKKVASINGIQDSKIALTIHDTFDHFWTYDLIERHGILKRYAEFLRTVGNPQDTDMYKREGELIASVSFEWRSSHLPERRFTPLFDISNIRYILNSTEKYHGLTANQRRAKAIVSGLDPSGTEARRLGSTYSGILVELEEQRRKHGFIRKINEHGMAGNLPMLDPEYLALIVEINHLLCNPKVKAATVVYHIESMVENYLVALARGETKQDLVIRLDDIAAFDSRASRLSEGRVRWLRKNRYHTATRIDACD